MFRCSTIFLRLCLLVSLLNLMGLDDAKKVHGASQLTAKFLGSHGSSNGLTTNNSSTKKLPVSLTQGLELVTGGPTIKLSSSIKSPAPVKVFTKGTKNESEENRNVKKKKKRKKKSSRLPVGKGGGKLLMIKGGNTLAFQDGKNGQKTMLFFSTEKNSRPKRLTKKIKFNSLIKDLKSSSVRTNVPTQRSIEMIKTIRSIKHNNNSAHLKSFHEKATNEFLDKRNWIQTKNINAKQDTDMEYDSSLSGNNGNEADFYESKFVTNKKSGPWRILESKKVLLSYPNDSEEEIISSIIEKPLSSDIASFERKIKLKKNIGGATDTIETSILNSTMIEKRPGPRQIDNISNHIRQHIHQHIFRGIGYPIYRWPWHMSVQEANSNGWQHLCYGAVVSRHSVLTNAECVYRKPLPSLRIVRHNIIDKVITLNNSSYIVARVIHPEYKRYLERLHKFVPVHPQPVHPVNVHVNDPHIRRNNLALLHMRHQFGVDPIHLDDEAHAHRYELCYTLDHRPVRLISNHECNYYYGAGHIGRSHLCAYGLPCYIGHHSGSPLVCSHRGQRPYLVGLSSYQQSCGHHHPTVYERIAPYTNWITRNLK